MAPKKSFRDALKKILTREEQARAIYGFDVLGDMALIEIPSELKKKAPQIARTLLDTHPYLTRVFQKVGEHGGKYRLEKIRWLAGEKDPEVVYKEWGCIFHVHPGKVFFNPRLASERQRMAGMVKKGQNVVVFFGGVGIYGIEIAKHAKPAHVVTIEWNPAARKYVEENSLRNKVGHLVMPVFGGVDKIPPMLEADHVIMPAPETALDYLHSASKWLSKKGGLIHAYLFVPGENWEKEAYARVENTLEEANLKGKVVYAHKVSDFSPRKRQVCVGIRMGPRSFKKRKPVTRA